MILRLSLKLICSLIILFSFGCKKDKSILGVDEQPSSDNLNAEYISGKPITAFSTPYDSIASYNYANKYLGCNNDPNFGLTDVGLYFSTSIDRTLNFGAKSRIASAEIILALVNSDFSGDKTAVLNYSIFPVTSTLSPSQAYFTTDNRRHNVVPVSTGTVNFSIYPSTGAPVFRIKIDSTYAEKLLHDTVNLASNELYQAAYPGYYIATSIQGSGEGLIVNADLDDALSGFYLHYKTIDTSSTITDWKFPITGSTILRYNTVKYTPKQEVKNQFLDSTLGSSYVYAKGMGISKIKLQIPFLQNYSDTFKIAVNRAEVVFYVDRPFPSSSSNYAEPPKLLLLSVDSLGRETYVKDLLSSTDNSRFDGTYDATNNRYVFNIAREAQQILDGSKKNRGFYIVVADLNLSLSTAYYSEKSKILAPLRRDNYISGIVFAGNGNVLKKPVFNLSYVRFKNE
ncbi:hypothetical protein CNR22_15545 [Sphingobacteriaceae bacterium]|nr:hypothetical protein CNR22_15545 [Sphingobacteriaceae bacterium]